MRNHQLILSARSDGNAAAASWGLKATGFCPLWCESGSLADAAIGRVSLHSDGQSLWQSGSGIDRSRFRSVWFRSPAREPQTVPNALEVDMAFLQSEWRLFQSNVYALSDELSDALWVNRPAAAERTENKIVQLQAAVHCDVRFPPTLVSNDPEKIRKFVRGNDRTIYKPFRSHAWRDLATGSTFDTPATILDPSTALSDDVLSLCPGIYQAYIEKSSDLRVTVIGNRFFPVRIRSRTKGAFVDWRPASEGDMAIDPCELPGPFQDKLSALMKRLGIVYGAIDLAVDGNGELYFLEVNQVGQFLFVERWLQSQPLLQAMCSMLAEGRTDYSLATCSGASFKNFLASDPYCQWLEDVSAERQRRIETSAGFSLESQGSSRSSMSACAPAC